MARSPAARFWHRINKRTRTPTNSIWLAAVGAFILGLPYLYSPVAYFAITSIAVIGLYVAYIAPVFLRLRAGDKFAGGALDARPLEPADRDRGHDLGGVHLRAVHAAAGVPDHDPAPSTTRRSCSSSSSAARRSGTSSRRRTGSRGPRSRARRRSSLAIERELELIEASRPFSARDPGPDATPPSSEPVGSYPRAMETARLVLDIGLALLLAAAAAGWVARRLGLPAVVGYLGAGLVVSPFTPGYVAERDQIDPVRRRRASSSCCSRSGSRSTSVACARDQGALLWAAPLQTVVTTAIAGRRSSSAGLEPPAAALLGLSIAMSSSVVIVNITRSRRTDDRPAHRAGLVGWGVLQDVTGVAIAIGPAGGARVAAGRSPVALGARGLRRPRGGRRAGPAAASSPPALRARPVPDRVRLDRARAGRGRGASWPGSRSRSRRSSPAWRSATAPRRPRPVAGCCPFRDVFAVFFFVAIGTLIDPRQLGRRPAVARLALVLVVVAKSAVAWRPGPGDAGSSDSPSRSRSVSARSASSASCWPRSALAAR